MTKKREKYLIVLMDDTDSDFAEHAPKPKAWKRLRKGPVFQNQINEVLHDDLLFHEIKTLIVILLHLSIGLPG